MYRKKEYILVGIGILVIFILGFLSFTSKNVNDEESSIEQTPKPIQIELLGEVNKETTLFFSNPVTYGYLWIHFKYLLNPYSDIRSFKATDTINQNTSIYIPTYDYKYGTKPSSNIVKINTATKEELMSLPQIGEKRSEKIILYIQKNGSFKSFDELWKVVSIANEKTQREIMEKAIL